MSSQEHDKLDRAFDCAPIMAIYVIGPIWWLRQCKFLYIYTWLRTYIIIYTMLSLHHINHIILSLFYAQNIVQ
ncbi:hypothetical protein V1506DRAFT_283348 [Lipomyces tetrasporus]